MRHISIGSFGLLIYFLSFTPCRPFCRVAVPMPDLALDLLRRDLYLQIKNLKNMCHVFIISFPVKQMKIIPTALFYITILKQS